MGTPLPTKQSSQEYFNYFALQHALISTYLQTQVLFASSGTLDLQWLVDQTSKVWFSGYGEESLSRIANHNMSFMPFDAWVEVIAGGYISPFDIVSPHIYFRYY